MLFAILGSGESPRDKFLTIVAYLCAILIAIIFHEFAHGYIAMKNGDYTAKSMGRLTVNPIKHLDIFGVLMFLVVGIGWAKPIPVNPNYFRSQKKGIFTVAIAGVTANFILAFISAGFLALMVYIMTTVAVATSSMGYVFMYLFYNFFLYSLIINISLIAFNLIPIFPLDGFRIVEAFTKYENKYCVFMRKYGVILLFGVMFVGSILGRYLWYLDIFGMYIGAVQQAILKLFSFIFRVPLG